MFLREGFSEDEYEKIQNKDPAALDRAAGYFARKIAKRLETRTVSLSPVTVKERVDHSSGKLRLIGKEEPANRLYDYVAVMSCEELWHRRLVPQQCSSIEGRGQVYGMRLIRHYALKDERAARYARTHKLRYTRQCKYFAKLDIRHCFQSVDRTLLLQLLAKDLESLEYGEHILYIWKAILDSYAKSGVDGIMIGSLPSQWAAQYLVSFIYRELSIQDAVSHIVIFMDDILATSPNRRKLLKAIRHTRQYAEEEIHLTIKPNFAIHKFADAGIDMMGYVVHQNGKVTIRAKAFIHARRMILRYQQNEKLSYKQAKRLVSYAGYFKHSDCRAIYRKYKLTEALNYCRALISKVERRRNNGRNMGTSQ